MTQRLRRHGSIHSPWMPWIAALAVGAALSAGCDSEVRDFGETTGGVAGGSSSSSGTAGGGGMGGVCTPGETRCEPDGTASTCDASGQWASLAACLLGCQDGACISVVEMSLGGSHTCALLSDGVVWCWGSSEDGQLGDGTIGMGAHRPEPAPISGLAGVVNVAAGDAHTCAALSDGTARCWGHGGFGKLGDGAFMSVPVPQDVPGLVGVAGIALGHSHTCAWLADGGAKCWGMNQFGQLGTGSTADAPTPANVMSLPDAAGISLGSHHTCARREGGAAACWGDGYSGQLGDGTSGMGAQKLTPSPVPGLGDVAQVGVGHFMSCARTTAGDVSCWGSNLYGQLGIGNTQDQASPAPVGGVADAIWLAAGTFHVCALRSDGTVFCWGNAADGRLGNGMASGSQPAPEAVAGLGSMAGVAAGGAHTCAWSSIGEIFCWGNNDFGQLGDGTSGGSKATPVQVKWP